MTTTESPNYLIDNPVSALQYLDNKFMTPIRDAIKDFRLQQAKAIAEQKIQEAQAELKVAEEQEIAYVASLISVNIE